MLFKQVFVRSFLSVMVVAFSSQAQVRVAIFDELAKKMKDFLQMNPGISMQNISDIKNKLNFIVQDVEVAVLNKPDMVERLLFENMGSDKGFGGYVYQDYLSLKNLAKEFKQFQSPLAGDPVGWETLDQFIARTYAGRDIVGTESQIKEFLKTQAAQDKDLKFLLGLKEPNRLLNFLNDKESDYAKKYYKMMKEIKKMYLGVFTEMLTEKYKQSFAEVLQNFVYVTSRADATEYLPEVFDEKGIAGDFKSKGKGLVGDYVDEELTTLVKKANGDGRLQLSMERLAKEYGEPLRPLQRYRSFYVKYKPVIFHADEIDDFLVKVLRLLK